MMNATAKKSRVMERLAGLFKNLCKNFCMGFVEYFL